MTDTGGNILASILRNALDNKPEEYQIYVCSVSPGSIRLIKNPSEKVQRAAMIADPGAFVYIKNPIPEILEIRQKHEMYRILTKNL